MSESGIDWVAQSPAKRAVLPVAGVVLAAVEGMHLASVSGLTTGLGAAAVTAVTYAAAYQRDARRAEADPDAPATAGRTAVFAGMGAAWLTAADVLGPLAGGTWHPLTIAWAAGTFVGYRALRRCEAISAAREWRAAKADWLARGPRYGLANTHLHEHEHTRLGESWLVDTTGTGRRASSFIPSDLAERIAEVERLPVSRVRITAGGIAGRIRVSVRTIDPWAKPVEHPVLAADPELDLPVPCSVHDPLPVGIDPETGVPLLLPLWREGGARNVVIMGQLEAGKTVLLNNIRERLTAAEDVLVFDINVSKALEDVEWHPACDLTAITDERKRALGILRCALAAAKWRPLQGRNTSKHQPSREAPLIVVIIDEIDALVEGGDNLSAMIKKALSDIASKGRSEAVCLILAGQRATADWIGGANLRANINLVCAGKVNRRGEMNHLGDAVVNMPDMATYGAGHAGVWGIAEMGGAHQLGRTFNLESPVDLRHLAAERAESQPSLEPGLVEHLGELYAQLKGWGAPVTAAVPVAPTAVAEENGSYFPVTQGSPVAVIDDNPLTALDAELDDAMTDEMREQLKRIDARAADTRHLLAETDKIVDGIAPAGPEASKASARGRWDDLAAQTEIPPDARERILELLAGGGMSASKIAEHFPGTDRRKIISWLNRLRHDGAVQVAGKGRGARWILASHSESGDAQ